MPLVPMSEALADRRAVCAFNAVQLEVAEGIVAGAEAVGMPVVLQLSENAVKFHGALAPIGDAFLALARGSSAAVVVHLDHATEEGLVDEAITLGFTSVMYDGAHHEDADNAARTAAGRPHRQEQDPQQGGLPRAGRAGEKLEGMGRNLEAEVAQNLRAEPVAQTDIFEPDQS